ncbi:hypothetical protein SK128_023466 [Halocaridina rubra]|uniref:Uncharacterized protein n=1 Tax=Halocaridina rubra TaxID=373956 RepID=A0AAN8XEJ6_HALRR
MQHFPFNFTSYFLLNGREYHEKKNLTYHKNNTVTYFQERWWHWDQESSGNNSQDDIIVTLNTIPVSAAWSVRNNLVAREFLNEMMLHYNETLIIEATASEIMFDGVQVFENHPLVVVQSSLNISAVELLRKYPFSVFC